MTRPAEAARLVAGRLLPRRSDYTGLRRSWRADLFAGATVGVVALPLALAFGISSGVGAAAGLVTAVVAGLVAAVFGGSNVQVSGPTGAMAVVLAPIVADHGLASVALVTIVAGVIVLVCGVTGLGRAVAFIPWPVIEGFTLGIATIIFLQQLPAALGETAPAGQRTLPAAATVLLEASWPQFVAPVALVVVVAATMLVLPRIRASLPASLIAVIVATVLAKALSLDVATIGALPSSLPTPVLPAASLDAVRSLGGAALAIAALAAIESLLSARVASTMAPTGPYQPDRELTGQGLASIASGLFGGMPATGAIARTAVNVRAGARTRVSAITHSVVLLAVVYLASGPVATIPLAALAGVLMVTSFRMISLHTIRRIVRASRADAAVFAMTALITVCFDLIEAVEIGLVAAAFLALRSISRRTGVEREELAGPAQPGDGHIALFRIDGALYFGAAEKITEQIDRLRTDAEHRITVVVIRMSQLRMIDATGANTLVEIVHSLEARGITVIVKGVQSEHLELLRAVGLMDSLRHRKHFVDDLDVAIEHARSHVRRDGMVSGEF